jgi:molybdopterin converting factor small subunit
MTITVEYFGQLRQATGTPAETIELQSQGTLDELLNVLARRHGWSTENSASPAAAGPRLPKLVFVNDESAGAGSAMQLHDRDVVTILSPIAGG